MTFSNGKVTPTETGDYELTYSVVDKDGLEGNAYAIITVTDATNEDARWVAMGLIDHDVTELYAAIGTPISSNYSPGCLEPNYEDGELVYPRFVVYTVRTAEREYVYDVE